MSSITGAIAPKQPELFALKFRNIDELDFVYTLASAITYQSTPNMVKTNMTNRSQMSLILYLVGQEQLQLFVLELGKIPSFDFVCTYAL